MGKCSKCSNAQASYYDPDDGPGRYCKQCARDVPNVVSRWQRDKKRKAEARGEGAGAGSGMGQDKKRALDVPLEHQHQLRAVEHRPEEDGVAACRRPGSGGVGQRGVAECGGGGGGGRERWAGRRQGRSGWVRTSPYNGQQTLAAVWSGVATATARS